MQYKLTITQYKLTVMQYKLRANNLIEKNIQFFYTDTENTLQM